MGDLGSSGGGVGTLAISAVGVSTCSDGSAGAGGVSTTASDKET